ncbi:MAG: acyl-CoA dehydrogenase family protein [Actinomycetota bacterium]
MVDFALTDEQELLRDTARSLFTKECPPALLRDAFYDVTPEGPAAARSFYATHLREWAALGDGPLVDLALFMEESGAVLAPGPLWVSSSWALPLLRAADHPDADAVADGSLTATVAVADAAGRWEPGDHDESWFVPHLEEVDRVVVVRSGPSIVVVDAAEVVGAPIEALDRTRPLHRIATASGPGTAITEVAFRDATDRATVALSAELVGVGRWLQDTTLSYVNERVQFAKPVGSFQGLQWKLVDASLHQERAAAAVAYAAMCVDADDADRSSSVHVAKAAAGGAARHWSRTGLQAHGGIGYTWEHDLHLRLRRAYGGDHLLGDADWHRDQLAALLFD